MIRHPRSHLTAAPAAMLDGLLVVVLVIIAFLPALFGGFLGWDDDQNFVENPGYRGLDGPHLRWMLTTYHMGHWKPLTWLTHGVDHALWGMHPMGYKAITILLHALATLVVLHLARRLLGLALDRAPDGAIRVGALGAALLWALHPLRVEPVVWLSARGDVVAGLGAFVTVLAYLRAHRRPPGPHGPGAATWSPRWYGASLALYALALMGKSIVVTLPVVLLILDVYPLRRFGPAAGGWRGPAARRAYGEKAPFLALAAVASVLAVSARIEFGSLVDVGDIGWLTRVASALYALAFHLAKTLVPVALSPLYDFRATLARGPWPFVVAAVVVAALTVVAVVRARRWPALAATWATYVVVLLPVSGLVQNGPQIAADRYTYLAGIPWALLAGAGLAWCAAEVAAAPSRRPFARCVLALGAAACVALVSLSAWQVLLWQDTLTLWSRVVALQPGSALAHTGLGTALLDEGRRADAAAHYRRALALFPQLPEAEMGLALILGREKQTDEAVRHARLALARQPKRAGFRVVLAEILWQGDRRAESLAALDEGARLAPGVPYYLYLRATRLAEMGRAADAVTALEEGHRLQRAAGLPVAESDRHTALVYASIDPPTAVAAWQRYLLAMSRVPRPTPRELTQLASAVAALEELTRVPSAAAISPPR